MKTNAVLNLNIEKTKIGWLNFHVQVSAPCLNRRTSMGGIDKLQLYSLPFPKCLVLLFLLFVLQPIAAQTPKLDSVRQVIATSEDTIRFAALLEYGSLYRRVNPDSAIAIFSKAIEEAAQFSDLKWQVRAYTRMGITYGMLEENSKALEFFQKSLHLNQRRNHFDGMATDHSNMGIVYKNMGDYSTSLNYYLKALQIQDSIGNKDGKITCYANLGVLYDLIGDQKKSRAYYERELELIKELGKDDRTCLYNLALLDQEEGNYEAAIAFFNTYLEQARKEENPNSEAKALGNLGHIYKKMEHIEMAEKYLLQSIQISERFGIKRSLSGPLFNLIELKIAQGAFVEAEKLALDHLTLAKEREDWPQIMAGEKFLSQIYEKQDIFDKSLDHHQAYVAWKDSLHQQERKKNLQQWQARLSVHEKDQQLKAQDLELELLNTRMKLEHRWIWILGLTLLFVGISALLLYQKNQLRQKSNQRLQTKNKQIAEQKSEIELMNQELEKRMLRAQINPHFIFNSLSSIQHFITSNDKRSALIYLSKFSTLLRQTLENSINVNVVLAEEIRLLKTYLELEALRFDHQFSFSIDTDESLDPYGVEVPILLVQPYVENAILHGLLPKQGDRQLRIHFSDQTDFILCTVQDNGIGRKAAAILKTQKQRSQPSHGMSVTQKRLASLYQNKDATKAIFVNDLYDEHGHSTGTEIRVCIPK